MSAGSFSGGGVASKFFFGAEIPTKIKKCSQNLKRKHFWSHGKTACNLVSVIYSLALSKAKLMVP